MQFEIKSPMLDPEEKMIKKQKVSAHADVVEKPSPATSAWWSCVISRNVPTKRSPTNSSFLGTVKAHLSRAGVLVSDPEESGRTDLRFVSAYAKAWQARRARWELQLVTSNQ